VNQDPQQYGSQFRTTHWSVVLEAGGGASPRRAAALDKLCRAYWEPICAFARRRGRSPEDAKDLTQEFFALLLERQDFAGLDPRKGKFRTFLLAAFSHYLANDHDRATALKRGGGQTPVPLDHCAPDELSDNSARSDNALFLAYDRVWAGTILLTALERLRGEMSAAGKARQFAVLERFLTPTAAPAQYAAAAAELTVAESSVPVLVHRLRQQYRALVRDEVAQTVSTPMELEEEMRHLFAVLNQ